MNEYEVLIETINPCGGSKYSRKEILEVEADSPEAYVREHGRWPILSVEEAPNGDVVITTGDCAGNVMRYVFSE